MAQAPNGGARLSFCLVNCSPHHLQLSLILPPTILCLSPNEIEVTTKLASKYTPKEAISIFFDPEATTNRRSTTMANQAGGANELLSAQKSSDSGLQIILHPLPILEISDFITRGYQRNYKGAVVGGLLGQQNGREITIEHSFSIKSVKKEEDGGVYELDEEWFRQRLDQSMRIHPVI